MLSQLKGSLVAMLRDQVARVDSVVRGGVQPEREVIYQNIFDRDLSALSVKNNFYPLNAAANYSLLYLVLRSAIELDLRSIVELGAGQSSLLIDALRKRRTLNAGALTIEHDPEWGARIATAVDHEVAIVPLVSRSDGKHNYEWYDLSAINLPTKIDFLLIDGPLGWGKGRLFARHGAIPLLDHLDPDGFVVIVDDAERAGEGALAHRICGSLKAKGVKYRSGSVFASKRQEVIASGRMLSAAFY